MKCGSPEWTLVTVTIWRQVGPRHRLVAAGVLLYAAAASLTAPLTSAAGVAVLIPAVLVLVLASRPPSADRRRIGGRLSRTVLAWGAVVALTAIWDLVAWLQQPAYDVASAEHPTVSLLLDPLTGSPAPRFLLWCLWLYVGYRLVRR